MPYRYRLPILAGLLIGTSYIPFPPWALLFCMVPLWLFTLSAENPKQVFWGAWLTQFILNAIGFHWIAYTAMEFGHFPAVAGLAVLIGFCAIAHLYFPISCTLWFILQKRLNLRPVSSLFLLPILFAICERLYPTLFPWHLGYPWLWIHLPAVQVADLIGFEGLSLLTLLANATLLLAWQARHNKKRALSLVGIVATGFVLINLFGFFRKAEWDKFDLEKKFLVIQGNIGNLEKIQAEKGKTFQDDITKQYLDLTSQGLSAHPEADMILWPETAFPSFLNEALAADRNSLRLREFLRSVHKPILTGSYSRDTQPNKKKPKNQPETYNGFFLLDHEGNWPVPPYHKTLLLAFGEYFPGADWFPFIMKLFPDLGSFGRGSGPTVMTWQDWRVGPQICYEGLYPWFSRQLSEGGAEIFVNVTNDSWFWKYFEPRQHLYMTLARALEFRRPLVRATNTGFTTAVLANGEILQRSPLHEEWFGLFKVPYRANPPHTLYERLEPLWIWILLAASAILITFGTRKRTDDKSASQKSA